MGCNRPGKAVAAIDRLSLLLPLFVVAGYAGLTTNVYPTPIYVGNESDFARTAFVAFMFSFGFSVACQIPFWILRLIFGWQLVPKEEAPEKAKFSIQELFILTAIYALAFSLPGYAIDMALEINGNGNVEVGASEYFEPSQSDPNLEYGLIHVTEQNVEQLRERRIEDNKMYRSRFYVISMVYYAIFAVAGLLFSPVIWLCLRRSGRFIGLGAAAIYLNVVFVVPMFLFIYRCFCSFIFRSVEW